ncbi:glycosyltransferase [Rhizobium sp. FKL33]|uniref:glycosyltransferase n=1 Tax=Rhizobium sp. FKL33 TaxID=2562307 RepID=UPI0014850E97|nr:glycosyltransferase [Rhizobium sp. FKL33]
MTMSPPRILQIAHNHPIFHAGGTELTAMALHRQALAEGVDSWFLGALDDTQIRPNQGTQMIGLSEDGRESALFAEDFKRFSLSQEDFFGFQRELQAYLRSVRPDVVHVHHMLNFGLEALHLIRNTLPDARMILTLHDYYLICANNGQLFKHDTMTRCRGPQLHDCLKCIPQMTANDFSMRQLDITHALRLFDHLVSPSYFLKSMFEGQFSQFSPIEVIENGYFGEEAPPPVRRRISGGPIVFGYFGNISAVKGLPDLLTAADILLERGVGEFRIRVHGAQLFEDKPLTDRMALAKSRLGHRLTFQGAYQGHETGRLMSEVDCVVFPSIWWENAPLVINEALYCQRPVIAYPHGGAPEILKRHGGGLFPASSDPEAMADLMQDVIEQPSLLDMAFGRVPDRADLLRSYMRLYRS